MNVTASELGRLEGKVIDQIFFNKEVFEITVKDNQDAFGYEMGRTLRVMRKQDDSGLTAIIY